MQSMRKTLEKCLVCLSLMVVTGAGFADVPARNANAMGRSGRDNTNAARMPIMPILPVSGVGNLSISSDNVKPVNPTPDNPTPDNPTPDNPTPDNPTPDNPTPDTPVPNNPASECPDGGVANSSYTVDTCMNDVLACVNGGALPNGINSLFNEDLRNSIVNGMGLCLSQVENCVTMVRRNCQNVYSSASDVWLDFNARKVQPEYYSFVLRQTGLTPTQAENTCLLLDRNTYGVAFDAVSATDQVTSEYAKNVGAYNSQKNNTLSKANPLGATVNSSGIDGKRGYYARWDAENAQCLLRVAAYNKDDHITNSWLFGIAGDETPAEVWKTAGSTFTCNKDLFGFSLMPKTKTTAAVAIPGGTLLGAGIGALAGHGDTKFNCEDKSMRDELLKDLQDNQRIGALNQYLETNFSTADKTMSRAQCNEIIKLYDLWQMGKSALEQCNTANVSENIKIIIRRITETVDCDDDAASCAAQITSQEFQDFCETDDGEVLCKTVSYSDIQNVQEKCYFRELNLARRDGLGVHCKGTGNKCVPQETFERDLADLDRIFASTDALEGQKSNRLKTTLIGAGIGAGVGGTATAITAFVERNNINCRVADGLARVGFGKSYTIDRLRDFYVKWALNLPNTIAPTAVVTNCDNWQLTCAMFTDLNECSKAQFNYRPGNLSSTTLVQNPCKPSGSACIANLSVAKANGACMVTPDVPDNEYPIVTSCKQWLGACEAIVNPTNCNSAKIIYTPKSMQVSTACTYNQNIKRCQPNRQKVRLYMDGADCAVIDY